MPELPEVETTRRGLSEYVLNDRIVAVSVRESRLRWPVSTKLAQYLSGQYFRSIARRAKYLLFNTDAGTMIVHLGMSGSLRLVGTHAAQRKHDHLEFLFSSGQRLVYHDPRRFGSILWTEGDATTHPLLAQLGPEPLGPEVTGHYLHQRARGRRVAVKTFLMNSHVVVGVGNIYASEALHIAGIHPHRPAGRISRDRYQRLSEAIRQVLQRAIEAGGTTLRDFVASDGSPGYFAQRLLVYGRDGETCLTCGGNSIRSAVIGQRSSFYCVHCQH